MSSTQAAHSTPFNVSGLPALRRALPALLLLAGGMLPGAVGATCTVNGSTETCGGNEGAIVRAPGSTYTLRLNNDLDASSGGIAVNPTGNTSLTINRHAQGQDPSTASLDPVIGNATGDGISMISPGSGTYTLNLTDPNTDTGPGIMVTGGVAAVRMRTTGTANVVLGNAALNGGSEGALNITSNAATLDLGPTGFLSVGGFQAPILQADVTGGGAVIDITKTGSGATTINSRGAVIRSNDGSPAALALRVRNATGNVLMSFCSEMNRGGNCGSGTPPETTGLLSELVGRVDIESTGVVSLGLGTQAGTSTTGTFLSGLMSASGHGGNWTTAGTSFLGEGDSSLGVGLISALVTNVDAAATTLDFGAGDNTLLNVGVIAMGEGAEGAATLVLQGLTTWRAAGPVLFGVNADRTGSDGVTNDRIVAQGTRFVAAAEQTLFMDVDTSSALSQPDCTAAVAADCLDLRGGATDGSYFILINDIGSGVPTLTEGIVLVDVEGGTSEQGHFLIDGRSTGARRIPGTQSSYIDRGPIFYDLLYNAETQQHRLVGLPDTEVFEYAALGNAAYNAWRTTVSSWFDRQSQLRRSLAEAGGHRPGLWLNVGGHYTERERFQIDPRQGNAYPHNTDFDQNTLTAVLGVDLINHVGDEGAWTVGLTVGDVDSEVAFGASATEVNLSGQTFGGYASYANTRWYVDLIYSTTDLDVRHSNPTFAEPTTMGSAESEGWQLEGGMRFAIGDAFIEPLVTVSQTTSEIGDMPVGQANQVNFAGAKNARAALGARLSGDLETHATLVNFSFTGRLWSESEGEHAALFSSGGQTVVLGDDVSGSLTEIGIDLNMAPKRTRGFSGFLGLGAIFQSKYRSADIQAGLRYQW